jgi:GeoRSP system SPASM domain protein
VDLKELSFPVRAYWDLAPANAVDHSAICSDLLKNKVLSLHLSGTGFPLSITAIEIIDSLKGQNISVSLTMSADSLKPSLFHDLYQRSVRALFINAASLTGVESAVRLISDYRYDLSGISDSQRRQLPGISFEVTRENFMDLPEIVSFCAKNRVTSIIIPMQRLEDKKECFYLEVDEREKLAAALQEVERQNITITVHDPYLWRAVYPSLQFPEAGCEAANSMFYISPEADVYPCPTLPVKLGNLNSSSLRETMTSVRKKELRDKLRSAPDECCNCLEVKQCSGGCRGRTFVMRGSLNYADPACK